MLIPEERVQVRIIINHAWPPIDPIHAISDLKKVSWNTYATFSKPQTSNCC